MTNMHVCSDRGVTHWVKGHRDGISATNTHTHTHIVVPGRIEMSPHPQRVVDGVLLLILGHHQCEGVCSCSSQPDLGQVVWTVDPDTVDVRRGVRWGATNTTLLVPLAGAVNRTWEQQSYLGSKPSCHPSYKQQE